MEKKIKRLLRIELISIIMLIVSVIVVMLFNLESYVFIPITLLWWVIYIQHKTSKLLGKLLNKELKK